MHHIEQPISKEIWKKKYRFMDEPNVEATWARIADTLAEAEKPQMRAEMRKQFYDALEDYKFLPAGRITSGAGTGRNVTLFNCFVMGTVPDSMEGIFAHLKEAAVTMQQGGGIGYDFSTLRPRGAPVKGVAADASGPLSFMDVWDAMCRTVMSAGERRGAMMATMRCDHPDILDFIAAKRDPNRLRMFNLSVLVTDEFMRCVENDDIWVLKWDDQNGERVVETHIRARVLWDHIMESTYAFAEPGVIFIDRINAMNNLHYCESIAATNPCGEQPLPPYGACLLGSINLVKFVDQPFSPHSSLNINDLEQVVRTAVRMLDNVVDVSRFPLEQQRDEAIAKRRIGLGVTGLADMLAMMRLKYGSKEADILTSDLMRQIAFCAYEASVDLAREKGAFPTIDRNEFNRSSFMQRMPLGLRNKIAVHGIRNSHLLSIAPTGTISLYAGNVSSGIEPIFAPSYTRKVLDGQGRQVPQTVSDYAVQLYRELGSPDNTDPENDELPPYFVFASDLSPKAHVKMQAAAQQWVDSSISKTVNVPADITLTEFKNVYRFAYDEGCKGCTTYRPNEVTGSVLEVVKSTVSQVTDDLKKINAAAKATGDADTAHKGGPEAAKQGYYDEPTPRPERLIGSTYKVKFPNTEHALYVTVNDYNDGGVLRPFEVFVNSKNMEHYAWIVGLTRMVSAVFRRGGDVSFVAEELKAVFDPRGGAWMKGVYVPSVVAAIGRVLEDHLRSTGYIPDVAEDEEQPDEMDEDANSLMFGPVPSLASDLPTCSQCGSFNVRPESGCMVCKDCGFSSCG